MNTNDVCKTIEGNTLIFTPTTILHYDKKLFEPYNSYMYTFNAETITKSA
jgi:hypothetical protein